MRPLGKETGMSGIKASNVLSWTGPISTVDGVITGTVELRCDTRILALDATARLFRRRNPTRANSDPCVRGGRTWKGFTRGTSGF